MPKRESVPKTLTKAEQATAKITSILTETGCIIRSQVVIDGSVVTTKIFIEEAPTT